MNLFIEFTVWSTEDLATFSHYAMGKNVVFIEANKRVSQKIRDVLLKNNIRSLVEPSKKSMSDIFFLLEEPVVIFQRKDSYATFTQKTFGDRATILLDVMSTAVDYETQRKSLNSFFYESDVKVRTPTIDAILGDKLSILGPNTIGRYLKDSRNGLEYVKHLSSFQNFDKVFM